MAYAHGLLTCKMVLEGAVELTDSERLVGYLQKLYEDNFLSEADLIQFVNGIEATQEIPHPFQNKKHLSTEHSVHSENLDVYVANQKLLDREYILNWTKNFIVSEQHIQQAKNKMGAQTSIAYIKSQFHRVANAKNNSLPFYKKILEKLKNKKVVPSFEMMNIVVTESMWVEVVGKEPVRKQDPKHLSYGQANQAIQNVLINGKSFLIWPDDPVRLSWWSAIEFANKLSIRDGYTPVYDTSKIVYKEKTSLELGNLEPILLGSMLPALRINNLANGYRLPTEKEYLFAATNRGAMEDEISLENKQIYKNSVDVKGFINSTAQFNPLVIDGKEFYDLHTGALEWLHEPLKLTERYQYLVRIKERPGREGRSLFQLYELDDNGPYTFGFRLVRTVD